MAVGSGATQVTDNYSYDPLTGLLSSQNVSRAGSELFSISYDYGFGCGAANCPYTGQVTSTGGSLGLKFYRYDDLGRLRRIEGGVHGTKSPIYSLDWQQDYQYDRFGNRTFISTFNEVGSSVPSDGWSSLTYGATNNRITNSGFSYDPAGNQLQNNTGKSFVYDAAGRLVKVKDQNGAITLTTYTYGAANQRLITQNGNESSTDKTYYVWNGSSVIAEYSEQVSATMPKWVKNYIYMDGRLLATEAPNGTSEIVQYHHPDRLGTRFVTNNLDTNSFYQSTLPFGTPLDSETTDHTNQRFTSYDRSITTGLDYAVNRHYDPRQGRFTQPDPIGMQAANLADPQSFNMYSYVGNDPMNRVDPDGQFWGALIKFFVGLFKSLKPNVINGSFSYHNSPPISVSFTTNFQNIGVGYGGIGFALRNGGHWLPDVLGNREGLNLNHASGQRKRINLSEALGPCNGVTANDLNYDAWAGMQHITENHIDSTFLTQGKSKYKVNTLKLAAQPTKEAALKLFQDAVKGLNVITFNLVNKSIDPTTGNIVLSYGFPHTDDPPHTFFNNIVSAEWWVGIVGIDLPHGGLYTNVNTLILRPNCRDVVTSFPGTPDYFKDDDIRVGGASQVWSINP